MAANDSAQSANEQQLSGETVHLVCFRLGAEEYGLDIGQVQEINRMMPITRVPRAPSFMKGVVDLRERFGMATVEPTKATRIVVVEVGHNRVGLIVDGVSEVMKIPVERIDPAPEMLSEAQAGYVKGVGKSGDRLIVLLEAAAVIAGSSEAGAPQAS